MRRDEVTKDLVLLLQTEIVLVAAEKHCSGLCVPDAQSIREDHAALCVLWLSR